MRNKKKTPKPIKSEKRLEKKKKKKKNNPQLHIPRENLTTGYKNFHRLFKMSTNTPSQSVMVQASDVVFSWVGRDHQWTCRLGVCLAGPPGSLVKGIG